LKNALRSQHLFNLAGADPESDVTECAMGRRVAVAANNGHARQGQAQLGADDVNNALKGMAKVI
jgi:hypothetical protein